MAQEVTANQVSAVNAEYVNMCSVNNVVFNFPSQEKDKYVKKIDAHSISLPDGSTVAVEEHFRRGYFIDGQLVTANIFFDKEHQGGKVLTDITLVMKIDHHRNDKQGLILDIRPASFGEKPKYALKIGVPNYGDNSWKIPETDKYIQFLEIKRN